MDLARTAGEEVGLEVVACGAISAFGRDIAAHVAGWGHRGRAAPLAAGTTGTVAALAIEDRLESGLAGRLSGALRVRTAGELDPRPLLHSPKTAKFLTREMCLALYAAAEVSARLPPTHPDRVAIVLSTGSELSALPDLAAIRDRCATVDGILQPGLLAADLPLLIPATWPLRCLKATTACHLAAEFGWVGPNLTLPASPQSGLSAVAVAALLLASGAADIVVTGSCDSRIDNAGASEAVNRRCQTLGVRSISPADIATGVSEAAALVALARPGELGGARARLLAWPETHLANGAAPRQVAAALCEMVSGAIAVLGRRRAGAAVPSLWLDWHRDFAPRGIGFEEVTAAVAAIAPITEFVDVRSEIGDPGVAAACLSLAVVSARALPAIVASVVGRHLAAVVVEGNP